MCCLHCQCSTTELWQPDNHQFSQWHILTVAAWCATDDMYWVAAWCVTEAFSTNCAVWIGSSSQEVWVSVPEMPYFYLPLFFQYQNVFMIWCTRVSINWPPSFLSGASPPPVQAGRWYPWSLLCLLGLTWHHNHQTTSAGHRSGKAQ